MSKKLGYGFNEEKFRVAEKYLLDQGVILTKGGYSLNLRDSGSDITEEGKAIIREAKCFMFNYRSNR